MSTPRALARRTRDRRRLTRATGLIGTLLLVTFAFGAIAAACPSSYYPKISTKASVSTTDGRFASDGTIKVTDTVSLSAADPTGTGTIRVSIYGPGDSTCKTALAHVDLPLKQVSWNVNHDYSASFDQTVVKQAGAYNFIAALYLGNKNPASSQPDVSGKCGDSGETVTVGPRTPSIATSLSASSGLVGATVHDSATLSGATADAGGTVTYTVYSDSGCTSKVADGGTLNVSNASVPDSSGVTFNTPGTYYWQASYSGDAKNGATKGSCTDEQLVISRQSPSIVTSASVTGSGVVGVDSTSDSATVSGGNNPSGSIQFSIKAPDGTTSAVGSPVPVSGDGTYDAPSAVPLSEVGIYTWSASYSGDSLNNGAVDNGDNESVTSIKAGPSISTQASVTGNGVVGTDSTSDTATVSGGNTPSGSIQFSIKAPDGTTSAVGSPVAVSGDGTYDAPSAVPLSEVGTYTWSASYSGDSLNNGAVDNGDNESVTSIKASPSIDTTPDPSSGSVDDVLNDTANLSGGSAYDGSGSITFNLYGPSDPTCSGTPAYTQTVTADHNGDYQTTNSSFQAGTAGTWNWTASFSGDGSNAKAAGECGDESVVISQAAIHIVKTADAPQVNAGEPIGFTLTVYNDASGDAHGVTLSDKLPTNPGLSWSVDKTGAGWGSSCSIASGVLACGPVAVPAGTTQAASTFTVHITSQTTAATGGDCPTTGVVDNTGKVTTSNDGSDQSSASTCVQALVDLSVTKTGSPATQELGAGNITWTMVVTNNGPGSDTGVTVADPMPAGNTFVSAATTKGSCTGGAILDCTIGNMAAGEQVTITLVTTPSTEGNQVNTVNVVGDRPETNTANNTATATVLVTAPHTPPTVYCVAVSKVTPKQLFVGRKTKLTIHVTQHGKAVKGVHVRIKGPKLDVRTQASSAKGVIKHVVKMEKAGILIFTPIASKSCNTMRVGVTDVFTLPVTG